MISDDRSDETAFGEPFVTREALVLSESEIVFKMPSSTVSYVFTWASIGSGRSSVSVSVSLLGVMSDDRPEETTCVESFVTIEALVENSCNNSDSNLSFVFKRSLVLIGDGRSDGTMTCGSVIVTVQGSESDNRRFSIFRRFATAL